MRICGDFIELNKCIVRESFELPTVVSTLAKASGAIGFTNLVANSGFYQIKLDEESSEMTTLITQFGHFCYCHLLMGISSAPEHYMRRMAQLTNGLPRTFCLINGICVYGSTQEEHNIRLKKVLEVWQQEG